MSNKLFKVSIILTIISLLLIIFACLAPLIFTQCNSLVDFTNTGQIGDTIGGTMGPIVALAGVFMTFIAFLMQVDANKIQSCQLRKSFNLGRLENKIESRNALQLMSVDINVMIKDVDAVCERIDKFYIAIKEKPTGDIPFFFTPKQSRLRYTSINRNLVYNAFATFMEAEESLDDFRRIYTLMDFYSEGLDILYSNIYKPYTDDIMEIKKKIPDAFEDFSNALYDNTSSILPSLLSQFKRNIQIRLINNGILNVFELHKILIDKKYVSIYDINNKQYQKLLALTNSLITQNKMMINAMRDAKDNLQNQYTYEALKELRDKIDNALSRYTLESIQKEFDNQV